MTQSAPVFALEPVARRGHIGVGGFYLAHFLAAVFPITAGMLLYGWHATAVLASVLGASFIGIAAWSRIGSRGRMLQYGRAIWFAVLLSLMLPARLAGEGKPSIWPLIPLAALLVVMLHWLLSGIGATFVHPVLAGYLLLALCFPASLSAHRVLNRDHLLTGELFHSSGEVGHPILADAWISRKHNADDAEYVESAADRLVRYTSGREVSTGRWLPLWALLRDSMPPLEDLIIAGQPGAIGLSSAVAVIIGGLFLLYRGMIDFRIPLLCFASAYAAMLILPVPTIISTGPQWHWLAFRMPDIGWSVAITFVNYEVMASPLLFVAFFLATSTYTRPMTRRGRTLYAILLGLACAAFQLYVSVSFGPYLALLVVSLLTPELDRWFAARPLF